MQIIRLPEVISLTTLSRSTIYSFCRQGIFQRIKLGSRAIGFDRDEIQRWLDNRPRT